MRSTAVSSSLELVYTPEKEQEVASKKPKPGAIWRLVRMPIVLVVCFLWVIGLRKILHPSLAFLVYGTSRDQKAYWPAWMRRFLPEAFPVARLKCGKLKGLVLASPLTIDELQEAAKLRKLLRYLGTVLPASTLIALAGRLPGWIHRLSKEPLQYPYVDGVIGTCWTVVSAAIKACDDHVQKRPKNLVVCVLGGAGYIGSRVSDYLSERFRHVIAVDPRYAESAPQSSSAITYLATPNELVRKADLVIVLTAQGQDAEQVVPWLRKGVVMLDDTHPYIPEEVRQKIVKQGAELLKVTMIHQEFSCQPRLPGFSEKHIPGCLFEGIVRRTHPSQSFGNLWDFGRCAEQMGFEVDLAQHPD